jgi:ADP-ribosylglycohydrolase/sugar/nucleoside kinase (ribokinase family)
MTTLVAGYAALLDLILLADTPTDNSEVGVLKASPGSSGSWLPGGSAGTIALALRHQGHSVALWHPFSDAPHAISPTDRLRDAGIDVSRSPRLSSEAARCVMVYNNAKRSSWSTRLAPPPIEDLSLVLDDISHLVIAPVWGEWTKTLLCAAVSRNTPISLIGEATVEARDYHWFCAVLDRHKYAKIGPLNADILVLTDSGRGAVIRQGDVEIEVAARPTEVLDSTGAGDSFAGTFIGSLLKGTDLAEAGMTAAQIAARNCEGWGSWAAFGVATTASTAQGFPEPGRKAGAGTIGERVRGALAGLACGDAFGMPNSFLSNPRWRGGMEPGPRESPYHAGYLAGRITDDTEQALALTEALEDGFDLEAVAKRLNEWFLRVGGASSLAVGPSTMRALLAYQNGAAVSEIGKTGVTNGGAMRIAPIGIYCSLRGLSIDGLITAVVTACQPTHATSPAIAGASAIAAAVAAGIEGCSWKDIMARSIVGAKLGAQQGRWVYSADIAERIAYGQRLLVGKHSKSAVASLVSDIIGAGEPTTESVPAALAIADYAHGDPETAIEIAGNLRGDTDTVAAMAGAVCGAYAGFSALPATWRQLVSGVNQLDFGVWAGRLDRVARAHNASEKSHEYYTEPNMKYDKDEV